MADGAESGRLAELTIALSLATDLGTGQPMEHGLRTCWLSLAASEALGLDATARSCVYYVALLRFVDCTGRGAEEHRLGDPDLASVIVTPPGDYPRRVKLSRNGGEEVEQGLVVLCGTGSPPAC